MELKQEILEEINNRLQRLEEHRDDKKGGEENPYERLNHAISAVIGNSLAKELIDLRSFIQELPPQSF
ncbi:MAG: hypothetical protein SOX72_05515 [Oscillospiraceae bacterium]|nr:hypothetical protein [Oscillospiraceae bacterium]